MVPPKIDYAKTVGRGAYYVMSTPWKIINVVVVSLEIIGSGAKATPDFLTG